MCNVIKEHIQQKVTFFTEASFVRSNNKCLMHLGVNSQQLESVHHFLCKVINNVHRYSKKGFI